MTRFIPALGLAAALLGGLCHAHAQTPATASGPPDVIRSTSNGSATPPAAVLPGVTVNGRRLKPCAPRDTTCIDAISKEIWTRYSKEIETMCSAEQIRLVQQGFVLESLGIDASQVNNSLTPATRTLCDYGKKLKAHADPPKPQPSDADSPGD